MSSLQDRLNSALEILKEHNEAVGESKPGYIDSAKFTGNVKAIGGTSVERLKSFSYEDITQCLSNSFSDDGILFRPTALAKDIAKVFRDKEQISSETRVVSAKKADKMTPKELVENFDPQEPNSPVGKRLKDISRGEPFLVYSSGNTLNIEVTYKLLMELKSGFDGRKDVDFDGEIKEVFSIGVIPDNYAEENPLYINRPLRPDGTCDQTGRSWNGISQEVRQLIRLAIVENELSVTSIDKANDVLDLAVNSNAFSVLKKRYRKAAISFDKLKDLGNLPKLKISLKSKEYKAFDKGNKVMWTSKN